MHHDLERIIWQWSLQDHRFVPRRAHPGITLSGSPAAMAESPVRVIFDRSCGLRLPLDVCFSPKATYLLRDKEMTRWANRRH
jgi:hypothetical protein